VNFFLKHSVQVLLYYLDSKNSTVTEKHVLTGNFTHIISAKVESSYCYALLPHTYIHTPFLQRVSIACYAERCISHDRFCLTVRPTVWPSDRLSHAGIMPKRFQLRPCGFHWRIAPWSMILVSWRLASPRNSKGNIGSEGAKWERGSKNVAKIGNF